jgi:hypothetical protein
MVAAEHQPYCDYCEPLEGRFSSKALPKVAYCFVCPFPHNFVVAILPLLGYYWFAPPVFMAFFLPRLDYHICPLGLTLTHKRQMLNNRKKHKQAFPNRSYADGRIAWGVNAPSKNG